MLDGGRRGGLKVPVWGQDCGGLRAPVSQYLAHNKKRQVSRLPLGRYGREKGQTTTDTGVPYRYRLFKLEIDSVLASGTGTVRRSWSPVRYLCADRG
jgi:hypothetical protein